MVGVPFSAQVSVPDEMRPVKITAKPFPAGLRLNVASGMVSGVPMKAGPYATVFTATSLANRNAITIVQQPLSVALLNPRAQGTWQGYLADAGGPSEVRGLLRAFTVSAAGKVSAKMATANGTVNFSGASWSAREGDVFTFTGMTKKGESLSVTVDTSKGPDTMQMQGTLRTAGEGTLAVTGQRNAMAVKTDPDSAAVAAWIGGGGYYTFAFLPDLGGGIDVGLVGNVPMGYGYAGVTVSGKTPSPTAKVAGKLADGTALSGSFPVLNYGGSAYLPLFATPYKTGLFAGAAGEGGAGTSAFEGSAMWRYPGKSPMAKPPQTDDRFTLRLDILGGWYGTWAGVAEHYTNTTFRMGDYTVPVGHNAKGNLTIEEGGANTNNATLTVTSATGVFKGKSDVRTEGAAKPTSANHEGILTPFAADFLGLGFYLLYDTWEPTGGKPMTYPLKQSFPIMIEGD
jgi:hypothetical protein